jgi:hypothetical protein
MCAYIVMQICCYSKCGIILQGFNPHLLFGDHRLGHFWVFYRNKRFLYIFHCFML